MCVTIIVNLSQGIIFWSLIVIIGTFYKVVPVELSRDHTQLSTESFTSSVKKQIFRASTATCLFDLWRREVEGSIATKLVVMRMHTGIKFD